jgi:hypothetical protein
LYRVVLAADIETVKDLIYLESKQKTKEIEEHLFQYKAIVQLRTQIYYYFLQAQAHDNVEGQEKLTEIFNQINILYESKKHMIEDIHGQAILADDNIKYIGEYCHNKITG